MLHKFTSRMLKVFSKLVLLSLQAMCTGPIDYIGDNFCDDVTNNEECQWDGGDCCNLEVQGGTCTICACLDPNGFTTTTSTTMMTTTMSTGGITCNIF